MPTHKQLIKSAKAMGYEITPTLNVELMMLAAVSDDDLQAAHKKVVIRHIAEEFKVPLGLVETRLGDAIPKLQIGGK